MEFKGEPTFNPESYKGKELRIVHRGSLTRAAVDEKAKVFDLETVLQAQRILRRLHLIEKAGIKTTEVDNPSKFEAPKNQVSVVVGGAFDRQCIRDYQDAARKSGYEISIDHLLTLNLD